jgi:hypothetical protein
MSNAQDLGNAGSTGGNFAYAGLNNTYTNVVNAENQGSVFNTYGGIANSQSSAVATSLASTTTQTFQNYNGYMSNFTGAPASSLVGTVTLMDNQQVLPWPKDQQIYYKLVGFNTNTQTFETWVIAEEIVPRPETFDPTGNFPNIDYNVFFTPPSGNKLVNIKIVGRWIQ